MKKMISLISLLICSAVVFSQTDYLPCNPASACQADESITIHGILAIQPAFCISDPCRPCLDWTICTNDKTYFINESDCSSVLTTTIDGKTVQLEEGDKVVAMGIVKTYVDREENIYYEISLKSIQKASPIDWCTQWNVMEFRFNSSVGGDDEAKTYIYIAEGDTTIEDKIYTKISYYHSFVPENKEYVAAIRQRGDSVMVHYGHADYLLCDFGVKVGDERDVFVGINNWEYTYAQTHTYKNKVTDVSILPDGRKLISVDIYWGNANEESYEGDITSSGWIEGIGSTGGLLHTGADGGRVGGYSNVLLCASNKDDCVYKGEVFDTYGCEYNTKNHTALENVQTEPINAQKVMENGQVVIIRDGVRYNVLGTQVK